SSGFATATAHGFTSEGSNINDVQTWDTPFEFLDDFGMGDTLAQCLLPTAKGPEAEPDIVKTGCMWEGMMNDPGPVVDDDRRTAENSISDEAQTGVYYSN